MEGQFLIILFRIKQIFYRCPKSHSNLTSSLAQLAISIVVLHHRNTQDKISIRSQHVYYNTVTFCL